MSNLQPWRKTGDRFLLIVRLTPKAAKDAIEDCIQDTAIPSGASQSGPEKNTGNRSVLLARVRAVPEKGKANAALEKLIAKWLGLPKSAVKVTAGSKSRQKTVALTGDHSDLACRLEAAIKTLM